MLFVVLKVLILFLKVGESLGLKIKSMVDKGLKMNLMHLVGHSLGSHVSGFAGKTLITNFGLKLNRYLFELKSYFLNKYLKSYYISEINIENLIKVYEL